ncbi:MAG TPA: biotin/lipoyl-containing protein, partial [Pedococcus sp.]|nr:biotin/lipoyl-containing protein [Pedococcus sp.]
MSERVTMPALGESVTEGTVTRWLKNVGDTVAVDEPLLEVSTDKVDTEIPSPVAGVLQEILAGEDDTVPVGADLAVIGAGNGASGDGDGQQEQAQQDQGEQSQESAAPAEPQKAEEPAAEAPSTEQPEQPATSEPEQAQAQAPASDGGGGDGETVKMPALGESVTEGTVTRWLKAEGDEVAVDEPLLEVSTDKVDTEIPSPVAGTLTKILVSEDDTVPVGADLAVIGGTGGGQQQAPAEQEAPQQEQAQQEPEQTAPAQAPTPQPAPQAAQPAAASADSAP